MALQFSTLALHTDQGSTPDVAAPIHVSTTYNYSPAFNDKAAVQRGLLPAEDVPTDGLASLSLATREHIYSRDTIHTRDRVEAVLGALEDANAVTYASGLAAVSAAFTYWAPKRVIISKEGYHGTHGVLEVYKRGRSYLEVLHLEDNPKEFLPGDLIWLESPQNPRGEIYDIAGYKARCPEGAHVVVDSTFCPPPLQFCLELGADMVMHSSTKFLGGHSDMLGGVLMVKDKTVADALLRDRTNVGNVMGNFEAWLLLRSLRTLEVRVTGQATTAKAFAAWLSTHASVPPAFLPDPATTLKTPHPPTVIRQVWHSTLRQNDLVFAQRDKILSSKTSTKTPTFLAKNHALAGCSGVLAIEFESHHHARLICSRLKLFKNATSLGGVESLIEWRAAVDPKIDPRICRISIGLEALEDLVEDWRRAAAEVKELVDKIQK
ncbi:hypothetical protein HDU76_007695 [Blyttiomyces sp. JEL0837]|nr:hypothetical protein HDU76_007695 [Blyttiomyces sp. JEL0837]